MTGAKEKNIKDILGTDTASQEVAEKAVTEAKKDLDEEMRLRKIKLIKIGSVLTFVAIMMIMMTLGWFSINKDSGASGLSVNTHTSSFEIATSGNRIMHQSQFTKADNTFFSGVSANDGVVVNDDDTEEILSTYYKTNVGNNQQNIMIEFIGTEDDASAELEPGGHGVIKFYIIPSNDGDLSMNINLNLRGYYEKQYKVNNVTQTDLIDISTLTTANSGLSADDVQLAKDGLGYLNGHIFFFEDEGQPNALTSPYYYETPITDGIYHFSKENAEAGKLYPVTIYWMWPKTLGQITLKSNTKRSGTPIVKDEEYTVDGKLTDKGKIIELVKSRNDEDNFFSSSTTITNSMIENSVDTDNFKVLSRGYNNADETIGIYVRYMLLEITIT